IKDLWDDWRNNIIIRGENFDESLAYSYELVESQSSAMLHPYDDENVTLGQGTIVDDILEHKNDVEHIVLPVGGGGLLAGVLNRLKELDREYIKVTAVEAPGSDSLSRSMAAGKLSEALSPNQLYGGSAVRH